MIRYHRNGLLCRVLRCVRRLIRRYRRHGVARSCAALTYYLVFALFPLLVLVGTLPGALGLEAESLWQAAERFMPRPAAQLLHRCWTEAARSGAGRLLWPGVIFSLWLPVRAADCLLYALRRAFGVLQRSGLKEKGRVLLFTLWLTATLTLALVLITVGRRALGGVLARLGLPAAAAELWNALRFLLLGLVLAGALAALYMLALGVRRPLRQVLPGVVCSLTAWMALSVGFSYYVEHMADYTRLYGSVAAVVVTLLWLYMSGMTVIMGAELNAVLRR